MLFKDQSYGDYTQKGIGKYLYKVVQIENETSVKVVLSFIHNKDLKYENIQRFQFSENLSKIYISNKIFIKDEKILGSSDYPIYTYTEDKI